MHKLTTMAAGLLVAMSSQAFAASNVLNIYNWSDYIAPDTLKKFKEKTGIDVRYDNYDSNEILQAKLLAGKSGYDIVVPSSGFLATQIKAGVYQPLNKALLKNYQGLDPVIMKKMTAFDPGNQYAVPYMWSINTLAINTGKVRQMLGGEPLPANEWDLLFDQKYVSRLKGCGVSVLDTPAEALPAALVELGKNPVTHKPEDFKAAAELFTKVRPYITRFSSSGYINEMVNGDLCLVMGYSGDLNIAKRRAKEAKNGVDIQVLLPKKGVEMWVDSMVIPKDAEHVENAHKFIDFILSPENVAAISNAVTYANAVPASKAMVDKQYLNDPTIWPTPEVMKSTYMRGAADVKEQQLKTRLWTSIKTGK